MVQTRVGTNFFRKIHPEYAQASRHRVYMIEINLPLNGELYVTTTYYRRLDVDHTLFFFKSCYVLQIPLNVCLSDALHTRQQLQTCIPTRWLVPAVRGVSLPLVQGSQDEMTFHNPPVCLAYRRYAPIILL
jgi:hypothetical protein